MIALQDLSADGDGSHRAVDGQQVNHNLGFQIMFDVRSNIDLSYVIE